MYVIVLHMTGCVNGKFYIYSKFEKKKIPVSRYSEFW